MGKTSRGLEIWGERRETPDPMELHHKIHDGIKHKKKSSYL